MLRALGFSNVHSMQILFQYALAVLTLNNTHSQSVGLFRLVRQGCPIAPYLYVLVAKAFGYLLEKIAFVGVLHGI